MKRTARTTRGVEIGRIVVLMVGVAVAAIGARSPVYITTQMGAYSDYAIVSQVKLPFGLELTRRSTFKVSIDHEENAEEERHLWLKLSSTAGWDNLEMWVRVKASALATLPAVSDDLEPLGNLLDGISEIEVRLNGEEIVPRQQRQAGRLKPLLTALGSFLKLKAEPGKKDRVKTPAGKLECRWWDVSATAATPNIDSQNSAKVELNGRVCVSGEVPFRWVKSVFDWRAEIKPPERRLILLEGHHEMMLTDYQPRATPEAPPARPSTPLP